MFRFKTSWFNFTEYYAALVLDIVETRLETLFLRSVAVTWYGALVLGVIALTIRRIEANGANLNWKHLIPDFLLVSNPYGQWVVVVAILFLCLLPVVSLIASLGQAWLRWRLAAFLDKQSNITEVPRSAIKDELQKTRRWLEIERVNKGNREVYRLLRHQSSQLDQNAGLIRYVMESCFMLVVVLGTGSMILYMMVGWSASEALGAWAFIVLPISVAGVLSMGVLWLRDKRRRLGQS